MFYLLILMMLCSTPAFSETYEKVDENTVKIVNTIETTVTFDDLEAQLQRAQDMKANDPRVLMHDRQIAKIQAKIDEAKKLGVVKISES